MTIIVAYCLGSCYGLGMKKNELRAVQVICLSVIAYCAVSDTIKHHNLNTARALYADMRRAGLFSRLVKSALT